MEPVMPLQFIKALFPMKVQLERSMGPVMPLQFSKANFPMEVQLDKSPIEVS